MFYLDYAAATPVDDKVFAAMKPYFSEQFYNPSAAYSAARDVRADFENARHDIAQILGARPAEIVLTAGVTEAINLALTAAGDGAIVTSSIEHDAVLNFAKTRKCKILNPDRQGNFDLKKVRAALTDDVKLVSFTYVNSEIGTVLPVKEIAKIVDDARNDRLARGIKTPLYFHVDAAQAAGICDLNVARLGVDLLSISAAKCYGPKQVGALFVRAGVQLRSVVFGGGQEMGLRSGTENVAGAVGFAKALEIAEKKRKSEVKRLTKIRTKFIKYLRENLASDGLEINGANKNQSPAILNISLPHLDGERAVFALDQYQIFVSTGSACAANAGVRSHVLLGCGLSNDLVDGSLRISFGRGFTEKTADQVLPVFVATLREQLVFGQETTAELFTSNGGNK